MEAVLSVASVVFQTGTRWGQGDQRRVVSHIRFVR